MAEPPITLPLLALRNAVVFPRTTPTNLVVGRELHTTLLNGDLRHWTKVFAVLQKARNEVFPLEKDLHEIGVIATVDEVSTDEDTGNTRIRVTGQSRARITSVVQEQPSLVVEVVPLDEMIEDEGLATEQINTVRGRFLQYIDSDPRISETVKSSKMLKPNDLSATIDSIASVLLLDAPSKQEILEQVNVTSRAESLLKILDAEIEKADLREAIQIRVRNQVGKSQRDYYLREQMKAIQAEIGYDQEAQHSTGITPIFTSRVSRMDPNLCFVLMPFSQSWSDRLYFKLIRPTIEGLGLQCIRADNLTGQIIIEDIWTKINQCALIIADVTGRNPNVMYELGIVHTIGKPTILLTQEIDNIPFDFAHLRHYSYQDNIDGFTELGTMLREVATQMFKDRYGIKLAERSQAQASLVSPGDLPGHSN
jgi:Lon protease-like protein